MSGLDEDLRRKLGRHVRELRTARGLTLSALAEQVGVTPSALSQIELGKSEPSLGTLWQLGGVLKASLFDFFANEAGAAVDVTRAADRTRVEFERFRYEPIAVSPERAIDLFVLHLEPGHGPVRDPVRHPGEEAGLVLSGEMEVEVAGTRHRLEAGDGIWFVSTQPHTFIAVGDEPCVSVWADTIPEAGDDGDVWSRTLFGVPAAPEDRVRRPPARALAATHSASRTPGPRDRAARRRSEALALARRLPIDARELRSIVEDLSAIGSRPDGFRVTGTPEDRQAAELAAAHLRTAGLQDVALEPVTVDGWRLGDAHLELAERTITGASFGGAPGTPPGGIEAPLVDVRTGERRRLDRLDVTGRIALLDWHALSTSPSDVALELGRRGAVGVVLACFEGGPFYQAGPGAVGGFDSHWHAGAPPVLTIAKEDAAALRAELRAGARTGRLVVEADLQRDTEGFNTVAYLPGSEPGPPIVIGAHHDGWFQGAFDNATGVALLLGIAKGLAALGHQPRHTLCFTSRTAEEYGVVESPYDWCTGAWRQISETHPEWRESPFHLCLEASGHPGLRTLVEAPLELARWARSACRSADAEGWLTSRWRVAAPVTGTELWPYLVSGVPGLTTFAWETAFRRSAYHTPLDTPGIVDYDHLARVARAYVSLLAEADADPDAIHDHKARARHLGKVAAALGPDGTALGEAAERHGERAVGRASFTAVGRGLQAVDAAGDGAYPHAQTAADRDGLDAALAALEAGDPKTAVKALERVGANRHARKLSAETFAAREARRRPDAERLSWAAASHLTASPDLWSELATLREEPGSRAPGPWLERSLRRHREAAQAELHRRTDLMTRSLAPGSLETP